MLSYDSEFLSYSSGNGDFKQNFTFSSSESSDDSSSYESLDDF